MARKNPKCPMRAAPTSEGANSDSLLGFFARAPKEHHRLAPSDVGAARIGHFGFFRATFRDSLWPRVTAWLDGWV